MHPLFLLLGVLSAQGSPPPASPVTGAVSPLIPSLCRAMDAGSGAILRCAGLVGSDVFLRGPETVREVALVAPENFLPPPPPGLRLGRSVGWRLSGDRPVAAVLRYRSTGDAGARADVLVVLKPPQGAQPGCVVGAVEETVGPSEPAPERAAAFADRRAPLFRCGTNRPVFEGPWSPSGRAALRSWLGLEGN